MRLRGDCSTALTAFTCTDNRNSGLCSADSEYTQAAGKTCAAMLSSAQAGAVMNTCCCPTDSIRQMQLNSTLPW
jgi:hypothetical protein